MALKVLFYSPRIAPNTGNAIRMVAATGAEPVVAGKPFAPIYRLAFEEVETLFGGPMDPRRILAIGDVDEMLAAYHASIAA